MRLSTLPGSYAVCKFRATPPHPVGSRFYSLSVTPYEITLVAETTTLPAGAEKQEEGWAALMVEGPLDFALVGILAQLTTTLADADISLFALSTFDTDILLVKEDRLPAAMSALEAAGHTVSSYT